MPKGMTTGKLAALGPGWAPYIENVVRALGAPEAGLPTSAQPSISIWLDRLAEWNQRMDLTAARSPGELADLMLADAVVLAAYIAPGARLVDVGSGAGGPGLAIALLRPDVQTTLVEPMQKRASFLRTAVGASGAQNVRLVRGRGEDLARGEANREPPAFDEAVARATLPPPAWLALGARLVRPGGTVWVLLAREDPPEAPGLRLAADQSYILPHTGAERRAVRYVRAP